MEKVYQYFRVEDRGDGIFFFWGDRPNAKNAISVDSWREIRDFFLWAQDNKDIRIVVLASAVPGVFFAGADIKEFRNLAVSDSLLAVHVETLRTIHNFPKPIIAAVHGAAFGGGFELAMHCDIRIIADNAMFGLPETTLGICPGSCGTQLLPRIIGLGRAKEVILAGRILKAEECVPLGLAMDCVPEDALVERTMKIARRMLGRSPAAQAVAKHCIDMAFNTDFNTGLFAENFGFSTLMGCPDMKEGTAAFIEKRKPQF